MLTFADILAARERIRGGVLETPCSPSPALSEHLDCEIWCKLELLQRTGSFKERGARNALLCLSAAERKRGVIAASAGNHALALAWHGTSLGIPVTVVMPRFAPLVKQANCRRYGAHVELCGESFGEAKAFADELAVQQGLRYIHGYDDPEIITGAGTIGLEIVEQCPGFDTVIVPVGGAGLLAGVSLAVKELQPESRIVGVEPAATPCFARALEEGHSVPVENQLTLADGLSVPRTGALAFEIARPRLDRLVVVNESDLALAVVRLMEWERWWSKVPGQPPWRRFCGGKCRKFREKRSFCFSAAAISTCRYCPG